MPQGVLRAANTVFAVGYMFGTVGASGSAGTAMGDDVPFGQVQEIDLKDSFSLKELMGQGQLTAVSVGINELKITGQCKFAAIRARDLFMLRGGSAPTFGTVTTYVRKITDEPTPFNLHIKSPGDGSDIEIKIYNCISPELSFPMKLRDYLIPDFTFNAYGDPVTGKIMEILVPGDQTVS